LTSEACFRLDSRIPEIKLTSVEPSFASIAVEDRVAKWYICILKNPQFWCIFERLATEYFRIFYGHFVFYGHFEFFVAILVFYGHLVYFVAIWYTFSHFGLVYLEESGNPGSSAARRFDASEMSWHLSISTLLLQGHRNHTSYPRRSMFEQKG
jgi:hypothetical protein